MLCDRSFLKSFLWVVSAYGLEQAANLHQGPKVGHARYQQKQMAIYEGGGDVFL
jgi:hypothetical protein